MLREEVELSNTRTAYVMHIPNTLSLTSAKKQPQAEIAITFLSSQLHFNNVTSHALFYGGHLVMRKRCAVQNQGITLSLVRGYLTNPMVLESSSVMCCIAY